jgi:hypothetical protein
VTELVKHAARVAGDVARILRVCPGVEEVDKRRELLDAAGDLLEAALELLRAEQRTGYVAREVLDLLRGLSAEHGILSRECEGRLRERARLAGA